MATQSVRKACRHPNLCEGKLGQGEDLHRRAWGMDRRRFLAAGASTLLLTGCHHETTGGWKKSPENPVLGGSLGTCFDVCVIRVSGIYRMYFSWRPKRCIAMVESGDGIHWTAPNHGAADVPEIVLEPDSTSGWEDEVNRPVVLQREDGFHLWYTGQTEKRSWIGYARSTDGRSWKRENPAANAGDSNGKTRAVLSPEVAWEKVAVMAPHVLWDAKERVYKMWYSGGEQYEPNALGYATSPDGVNWTKFAGNPVMEGDRHFAWEQERVTAAHLMKHGDFYYAFYIGFKNINDAAIGLARSRDGIRGWERLPANPIVRPSFLGWDSSACYKPSVIYEDGRWMLWYNGRHRQVEQIGLATHEGENIGF
jgi:beta-1,2-mannobiose phosphorylase / 1,2-beta-oligomannan phosphorylase